MKKLLCLASLCLVLVLILAPTANASTFIAPNKDNGSVSLSSDDGFDNLYTAGNTVFINSHNNADVYTAGGDVTIESSIEGDVVVAGGNITINGEVGGDIRAVGGNITINNKVHGDVLVLGGTLHLTEKAQLDKGGLDVVAGQVTVDGPVLGIVRIQAGDVTINSKFDSSAYITAQKSLTLGVRADVPSIDYRGTKEATVQDGAKNGGINFTKIAEQNRAGRAFAGFFTVMYIVKLVGLLVAGLILMSVFPRNTRSLAVAMQDRIWLNLLVGIVALIVVPIVSIIVSVLIVGLYVGIILFLTWLLALVLASLVASVVTGAWLLSKIQKGRGMVYNWVSLLVGLIALSIVYLIPVVGFIVMLGLVLMGFGGLIREFYRYMQAQHNHTSVV